MPAPAQVRYTYADWLTIPEDRSRLYEIVDGALFVNPPPTFRHQEVAINVSWILTDLARRHGLGKVVQSPIGVRLDEDSVVEPDVLFLLSARLGIVGPEGVVMGPPDLVVEVLSPSNRGYDRDLKRKRYLASGVPELWLVDPDLRTVEAWRPGDEPQLLSSGTVDWRVGVHSFQIPLAEIFRS